MKSRKVITAVLVFIAMVFNVAYAETSKPNIVFILTDNLGYGEVGVYGGGLTRGAPTPSIDSLANEGMRFLNFNMETQCTPSRLLKNPDSATIAPSATQG